jgi:2',3'-cyclic-nucleotide 2'-phosphodiesterase (5'-nucleotidase family)
LRLQTTGRIRVSIGASEITLGEVLTVMPFGNQLVTLEMTGQEIITSLEEGVSQVDPAAGRFPQVSGLHFTFDAASPAMSRIKSIEVKQEDRTYAPIDVNAKYRVG